MSVSWQPDAVPAELVALTRRLGAPAADLVVVAEGNTSVRLADGSFVVKASGSWMASATARDFVVVQPDRLLGLLNRAEAEQRELTDLLTVQDGVPPAGGVPRRASIETLVHLAALEHGDATWVAHTHPPAVLGLLSVAEAEQLWSAPVFPDEAVVLGPSAFVPYAEPGLRLGRLVVEAIRRHRREHGAGPRLVLLGNHGIVALGRSAAEVEAVTQMAVKAARVRSIALGSGRSLLPLDVSHGSKLFARADEAERRALLREGSSDRLP